MLSGTRGATLTPARRRPVMTVRFPAPALRWIVRTPVAPYQNGIAEWMSPAWLVVAAYACGICQYGSHPETMRRSCGLAPAETGGVGARGASRVRAVTAAADARWERRGTTLQGGGGRPRVHGIGSARGRMQPPNGD